MDPDRLNAMVEVINEQEFAYNSVVVVRNGYIVFEKYINGYNQNSAHHLRSSTKSVSTLLGQWLPPWWLSPYSKI